MRSWTLQCINGQCNSCNVTNTTITGDNDTTQCTDGVQSFAVTSSVDFIILSSKDATRVKRLVMDVMRGYTSCLSFSNHE